MKKILALLTLCFSLNLLATDLTFNKPIIRLVPSPVTAGFVDITNQSKTDYELIKVESDLAGKIELHTHIHANGKMMMRQLQAISIPAGKTVQLKRKSLHLMFFELKKPLKEGEKHLLKFFFKGVKNPIEQTFTVKEL